MVTSSTIRHAARGDWYARAVLWGALLLGLMLRVTLAVTDHGVYWPDEIYQSIEPAHRLVYGYGMVAWEFVDGARNWALPWFVAVVLKLGAAFGFTTPSSYIPLVKVVFALIGTATAFGSYRLARAYGAGALSAAVGAALFSLSAVPIYFAPRAMSEVASALPLVFGLALVVDARATRHTLWLGGALLGVSVLLRLHGAVFCIGALGILAGRRQWKALRDVALILVAAAILFGLVDRLTWSHVPGTRLGGWFHSAITYLRFNFIENRAAEWGVTPPRYYVEHLVRSMPLPLIAIVVLSLLAARRSLGLFLTATTFFVLHSATDHKELRFIYPVMPLFCALAGIGLSTLERRPSPRLHAIAAAAVVLVAMASAATHRHLTFGQLGTRPERADETAYDDFGGVNRLMLAASQRADVCGLRVDVVRLAWTGGLSHLHKNVPLYQPGQPSSGTRHFNYLIGNTASMPAELVREHAVAFDTRNPQLALLRLFDDCVPDPSFSWRLPGGSRPVTVGRD